MVMPKLKLAGLLFERGCYTCLQSLKCCYEIQLPEMLVCSGHFFLQLLHLLWEEFPTVHFCSLPDFHHSCEKRVNSFDLKP